MKQHITIDQLNELKTKHKRKLEKWWKPTTGDCYVDSRFKIHELHIGALEGITGMLAEEPYYPLMSIGQMIEFLDVYSIEKQRCTDDDGCGCEHDYWFINDDRYIEDELCDALWEAVKEVLNG